MAVDPTPSRGPVALRRLVAFAGERGLAAVLVLRGTGLGEADLADPELAVDASQELTATRNVVERLGGDAALGAELGRRWSLSTFRELGFAMLAAPTGREAVTIGARHLERTSAAVRPLLADEGRDVLVVLDATGIPGDVRDFLVGRDLAVIATVWPAVFGAPLPPVEHTPRGPALRVGRDALDAPLPHGDAELAADLDRRLTEDEARRALVLPVGRRVAAHLRQSPAASEADVAGALGLAERSLRRRLAAEGTSFGAVRAAVLAGSAQALLEGGATVEDAARRLGFAEAASFTRAFRRWTGATPGAVRARARGAGQGGEDPAPAP